MHACMYCHCPRPYLTRDDCRWRSPREIGAVVFSLFRWAKGSHSAAHHPIIVSSLCCPPPDHFVLTLLPNTRSLCPHSAAHHPIIVSSGGLHIDILFRDRCAGIPKARGKHSQPQDQAAQGGQDRAEVRAHVQAEASGGGGPARQAACTESTSRMTLHVSYL
jgi:hypothetical protein